MFMKWFLVVIVSLLGKKMKDETITLLRALCVKVKEIANYCDAYLEQQSEKNKNLHITARSSEADHSRPPANRFIPITKWPAIYSRPSIGGFRHMIFCSHTTGADYFMRRAGRRILICEKSFFEWAHMSEDGRFRNSSEMQKYRAKYGKR